MESRGIKVAPTLISPDGELYIKDANFSDREVILKQKTRIGIVTQVQAVKSDIQVELTPTRIEVKRVDDNRLDNQTVNTTEINLDTFPGTREERKRVEELLESYNDVFYHKGDPLDYTPTLQHKIPMEDTSPITQAYRRVPPHQLDELKQHLEGLLKKGIIRESKSDFASPIVIVRKKSGDIRNQCVDFRKLNARVRRDAYPLPRISESLEAMSGARYFSTLDLVSAYNQFEVAPEDQHKTAFSTPLGLFEYRRMPFGLSNSPATFQRLMGKVFHQDIYHILLVYLDDVIIFSRTLDEHIERLGTTLNRLREHHLKLAPNKCHLFCTEVKFLGHVINATGITTDPDKICAVRNWEQPVTFRDLRRFMGFISYYRRFVEHFASVAAPLYKLIGDLNKTKKGKKAIMKEPFSD